MNLVTLEQVQRATGRCLQEHPVVDSVLPSQSRALVELLGWMFYARCDSIETAQLPPATLTALRAWGVTIPHAKAA